MKDFWENYEVILLAAVLGLFVYFTHGTPVFYSVIPLFVLISVNVNQTRKLKRLEIQLNEMKAILNDVKQKSGLSGEANLEESCPGR